MVPCYPTRVPIGCLKRIDFINEKSNEHWESGFTWGFGAMFGVGVLAVFLGWLSNTEDD
jgi:hypothetical protein